MSNQYADEGTIAHELAALCLIEGKPAAEFIGQTLESENYPHATLSPSAAKKWMTCPGSHAFEQATSDPFTKRKFGVAVNDEMAEFVQLYLDVVHAKLEELELRGAVSVDLLIEQSLPIGHITHEEGATGTGDAVIIAVWEDDTATAIIIDLKFGRGIEVEVENNYQLQMYACGAFHRYSLLYDVQSFSLVVHQPRINAKPSEWEISLDDLAIFQEQAESASFKAIGLRDAYLKGEVEEQDVVEHCVPGDHCRTGFCGYRANCPALAAFVTETIEADFDVIEEGHVTCVSTNSNDNLSLKLKAVDIIEDWCKEVRAESERRMLNGEEVAGFKLVKGRRGARAWTDKETAEALLKKMRYKKEEMYDFKLISPTTAEKLMKTAPRRWAKLVDMIVQPEGKLHVAPESDKRPAIEITPTSDDFEEVTK